VAQSLTDGRTHRPKERKLSGLRLRRKVSAMLRKRFSPEQIAARLKLDYPDDPEMHVSHETIYQAIYVQGRGALRAELASALRTGRALRKPHGRTPGTGSKIKDMVMISERSAEVEDRAVPGHWEGDLILGSTASASAIGTLVERSSGFVLLLHLPGDHTSRTVADAMITTMSALPEHLRRSLTWDQGSEMARHREISLATNLDIYFCDPHSPWQRGSNENTKGCCGNTSPRAPTCPCTGPASWPTSPPNSTPAPANATAGAPPPRSTPSYYQNHQNQPVMHSPLESALARSLLNQLDKLHHGTRKTVAARLEQPGPGKEVPR
jgi:IS30 family transposase